ncbi:hypothetical protein [Listeria rocourtiae]|uniref:hypothetical protein n=1 Tax=Listeria rocourtiae TaxID=647910 RepID=UPI003D2F810C
MSKHVFVRVNEQGIINEWFKAPSDDYVMVEADEELLRDMPIDCAIVKDGVAVINRDIQDGLIEENKELIHQMQEEFSTFS